MQRLPARGRNSFQFDGLKQPANLRVRPRARRHPSGQHPCRVSPASMPASDPLTQADPNPEAGTETAVKAARELQTPAHQSKTPAQPPKPAPESPTIIHGAPDFGEPLTCRGAPALAVEAPGDRTAV